jgi:nucleoside-diphosphate-sugar epimerase
LLLCGDVTVATGRTYLLAAAEPVELGRLLDLFAARLGVPPPRRLPGRSALVLIAAFNRLAWRVLGRKVPRADRLDLFLSDRAFGIARARRELGFEPRVSLAAAVARTITWLEHHPGGGPVVS